MMHAGEALAIVVTLVKHLLFFNTMALG